MVDYQSHSPSALNPDDPEFLQQLTVWLAGARHEINVSIASTEKVLAESRAIMVEADRALARR